MSKALQEALIYAAVGLSALFIMGYAVHMILGGLISETAEYGIIAGVCCIGAAAMGYMAWDVIRRRRAGIDPDKSQG
jgi:uncharacterized YccA/Bax inhibitor family protein